MYSDSTDVKDSPEHILTKAADEVMVISFKVRTNPKATLSVMLRLEALQVAEGHIFGEVSLGQSDKIWFGMIEDKTTEESPFVGLTDALNVVFEVCKGCISLVIGLLLVEVSVRYGFTEVSVFSDSMGSQRWLKI